MVAHSRDTKRFIRRTFMVVAALTSLAARPALAASPSTDTRDLDARILGLKADGAHDDASALEKAVAKLAGARATLDIHGCVYLSSGITIPPNVAVRFGGVVSGFTGPGAAQVRFKTVDGEYHLRRDFCSSGEWTDVTAALQNAVDIASDFSGAPVVVDAGAFILTAPVHIPSNVTIRGAGRSFRGTNLRLAPNTPAFRIDGAGQPGGWAFRIRIQDLLIDASASTRETPPIIDVRAAYSVDLANIWIHATATQGVRIRGSNDVTATDLVVYGQSTGTTLGAVTLDGTAGPVSAKLYSPDVESCNRGIVTMGEVDLDVFSPYVERAVVSYVHGSSRGHTSIFGGTLSSINGYPIAVSGDNLTVFGTALLPYHATTLTGLGVYLPPRGSFKNVRLFGVGWMQHPSALDEGLPPNTQNVLPLTTDVSYVAGKGRQHIDLKSKSIAPEASGAKTDLIRLTGFALARMRLELWGKKGNGTVFRQEFSWVMAQKGKTTYTVGPITSPGLEKVEGGSERITRLAPALSAPAPDSNSGLASTVLSISPVFSGEHPLTVEGELDVEYIGGEGLGAYLQ